MDLLPRREFRRHCGHASEAASLVNDPWRHLRARSCRPRPRKKREMKGRLGGADGPRIELQKPGDLCGWARLAEQIALELGAARGPHQLQLFLGLDALRGG